MPDFYTDGNTPNRLDTQAITLKKILGATIAGGGGSSDPATATQLHGSGSPEGVVSAEIGQHYLDDDTQQVYWKATGAGTNTGWI